MKTLKYILSIFLLSIIVSCSNDAEESAIKTQSNDVSIKIHLPTDGIVKKQFDDFLSQTDTRTANTSTWDFDNIVEFSSEKESIYCYMIADKNDPNKIIGGCSTEKDIITTFFTLEKNGEIYTLKDEFNHPLVDVKFDLEKNQILFVETYKNDTQTRATASEWCGLGMAAAWAVGSAFAPATLGASIGFAVCWEVVSTLMCR